MIIDSRKLDLPIFNNVETLFDDMCKYGLQIEKFEKVIDATCNNYYILYVTIPCSYDTEFFKRVIRVTDSFMIDMINNIRKTLDNVTIKKGEKIIVFYKTDLNKYWEQNDYEISLLSKRNKTNEEKKFCDFLEGLK